MFSGKDKATLVDLSDKVPKKNKKKATFGGTSESTEAQTEQVQPQPDEVHPEPNETEKVQQVLDYEKRSIKEELKKTFSRMNVRKISKSMENVEYGPSKSKSTISGMDISKSESQSKENTPRALSKLSVQDARKNEEQDAATPKPAKSKVLSTLNLDRSKNEDKQPDVPDDTKTFGDGKKTKGKKVRPSVKKTSTKVFWMTRNMAERVDRTLFFKRSLVDIFIYLVFVGNVVAYTSYLRNPNVYLMQQGMKRHFILREYIAKSTGRTMTFPKVATATDVWDFLKSFAHVTRVNKLYDDLTNPIRPAEGEEKKVLMHSYVLGVPRLRQLRVRNDSCLIHPLLRNIFRTCYDRYTESNKNKFTFGPGNGTAWTYHTEAETHNLPFKSSVGSFGGDGFYQDLYRNSKRSRETISYLENNFWITRETRVIFVDFALYNGNLNTFCVCKLIFFFSHLGGVIPDRLMMVSVLFPRNGKKKLLRHVWAVVIILLVCYYLAELIREAIYFKWKYIMFFWPYIDACIIGITTSMAYISFRHIGQGAEILTQLKKYPDKYGNMERVIWWFATFRDLNAMLLYLVYMKAFKYLNFNHTMGQLNNTIKKCRKDTASFSVMFFIVFCAFAELGYLLFGENTQEFKNFTTSMFSLLCTILGDFDYDSIEASNKVMAPIFFIAFIFFIFFVLINMFVAIISDSYSDVKTEISLAPNELQMSEYLKLQALQFFRRCGWIKDVEKKKSMMAISLQEIQSILSQCGFTDEEIESFLLKYVSLAREGQNTELVLKKLEDELAQQELAMGQMFQFIKPKDYFTHQEKIDQLDNSVEECTNRIEKLLRKLNRLGNVKRIPKSSSTQF